MKVQNKVQVQLVYGNGTQVGEVIELDQIPYVGGFVPASDGEEYEVLRADSTFIPVRLTVRPRRI